MNGFRFSVIATRDVEAWKATCPDFPTRWAGGAAYEEVGADLETMIQILIEDALADDETIFQAETGALDFAAIPAEQRPRLRPEKRSRPVA